jgi:GNAT superfamily N-acetyltransferase
VILARPLVRDDLAQVVEVVVSAFADYPYWRWLVADRDERAATMGAYYAADLGPLLDGSFGIADGDRMVAVAMWARSDAWAGFVDADSTTAAGAAAMRMAAALAAMASLAPAEPHWYLDVLAVRPERQGTGLGRDVLRPGLARADIERVGCYLETGRPENLGFYRAAGFEVSGECDVRAPDSGDRAGEGRAGEGRAGEPLHLWGLWRPSTGSFGRDHL